MRCSERQDRCFFFLRITQNGESVQILCGACCALVRWRAPVLLSSFPFSFVTVLIVVVSCATHFMTSHALALVKKVIRTVLLAFVTHFPNSLLPFFSPLPCTFDRVFWLHSPNFLIHQLAGFIGTWFVCPSSLWRCLASKSMQRRGVVSWS